jgi:hypothetical protein
MDNATALCRASEVKGEATGNAMTLFAERR